MKRFVGILMCLLLCGAFSAVAEDTAVTSAPVSTADAEGWKAKLEADKKAMAAKRQEMKQNSQAARSEEKDLRKKMQEASAAGDKAKAQELRTQLKTTHQQNVAEMKTDKKEMQAARKEMRTDRKEAWQARADKNKDGAVDATEKAKAKKKGWFGR
ncbi:MAG TPA: hypothetical protein PLL75_04235 [Candidatus Omnitrophota bacterium]|nr:hypothetical protein [Candidatus Omnitrophota bacterium]HPS36918.1 hypothetical protein [Candidatus Omnitrophota bacterium]